MSDYKVITLEQAAENVVYAAGAYIQAYDAWWDSVISAQEIARWRT